jgi:hypothetical protein
MTALIVHPAPGYNTFVDVAGADTIAEDYIDHAIWDAMTAEDKQRWLLYTGRLITSLKNIEIPDSVVVCLAGAQMQILMHILRNNLYADKVGQQVRVEYFNKMSIEYFKNNNADNLVLSDIPAEAWSCLISLGATKPSFVGNVGVFRRTR